MEREKILGKYFQGNRSYLKWNGSLTLCTSLSKHISCTHANTHLRSERAHKAVLETQIHTQMASLQTQSRFFGLISASPLPPDPLTRLFIFPMPTLNSDISPQLKRPVCAWPRAQKSRKISTSRHLHQNKNKQT